MVAAISTDYILLGTTATAMARRLSVCDYTKHNPDCQGLTILTLIFDC
jgi:hypothetical protein